MAKVDKRLKKGFQKTGLKPSLVWKLKTMSITNPNDSASMNSQKFPVTTVRELMWMFQHAQNAYRNVRVNTVSKQIEEVVCVLFPPVTPYEANAIKLALVTLNLYRDEENINM